MADWTKELFIDKSDLFLVRMNAMWRIAQDDATGVANIIRKYHPSASRVLDLMCGNGRISINLAKLGFDVVGLDFSERFIEDAKRRAKELGVDEKVHFIVGDARRVDEYFGEEFDVVLNFWTSIGYYGEETDREIFQRVYRIVRPGGLFLILNTVSLELLATYYRNYIVEFYGENIFIDINEFDVKTATLNAVWKWYKKEEENLRFINQAELRLRVYTKHEVVKMLQDAGWVIVDLLHSHRTIEKAGINSPINIVARKQS